MSNSELPVLQKIRDLLFYESDLFTNDTNIYIDPDDIALDPPMSVPFCIVRIREDSIQRTAKNTFKSLEVKYRLAIRWYLAPSEIEPATPEFAEMELEARRIKSGMHELFLKNQHFGVGRIGDNAGVFSDYSVIFMTYNSQIYSGCEYVLPITQPIQ